MPFSTGYTRHPGTAIEIDDRLLNRIHTKARREGKTLRAVVEEALREAVDGLPPGP